MAAALLGVSSLDLGHPRGWPFFFVEPQPVIPGSERREPIGDRASAPRAASGRAVSRVLGRDRGWRARRAGL